MSELNMDAILGEEERRFKVTNDQQALWAVRQIANYRAETEKWQNYYKEQMKAVESRNQAEIDYFSGLLHEFFDTVPHKDTKTQSTYQLPGCKLIRKKQDPKYETTADLLPYLKENGFDDFVKVSISESADWNGLKKRFMSEPERFIRSGSDYVDKTTGEVIPGITVTDRGDKFDVIIEVEM